MTREEAVRRIEWAAEKKLKELDLSGLGLEELPVEIGKCTQLETLLLEEKFDKEKREMVGNKLTEFPDVVLQLTNLKILNLNRNQITSIPDAIGKLSNLTELCLTYNQITSIPDAIGKLSNLIALTLFRNPITQIPEALGQLSNLERLTLGDNQITSIPKELGQLSNLSTFWLCHSKITSIPKELGQLSNLSTLGLNHNKITSIPKELGQLSNLSELYLWNNQLTSIPKELGQLSNLERLILNFNQITSIPKELGQLSNLIVLMLDHNKIASIPEELGQLLNLKELRFLNNQITEIPEVIHSMKNLENLDLRGNPVPIPPQLLGYGQDLGGCGDLQTILDYYFHTRNPGLPELDAERQKIESEGYFDVKTLKDARRRTTASIVQRQGQAEFRRKLLTAYGGRCPITDCDVESAIEAAHIIPYQGTQTNHPTNGLPLRADIHTLFDLHLLSIRPDTNEVVIAPELVGTCYQDLANRKLTLPQDRKTAPNQNALSKHHETFLSKCKGN